MLVFAVTLHNLPEGMAVGVVFAGLLTGSAPITVAGAFALTIGIAIQNFPEAVSYTHLLSTEKTVTEDVTSIGIRAHDFEPVKDPEGINHIPVGHAKISEMPFEWYVTLQNGLWWKIGKTIHTHSADGLIPEYVRVAPEAILLLKG